MSIMENVLERLNYGSPKTLETADFTNGYEAYDPISKQATIPQSVSSIASDPNAYVEGETIHFGVSFPSNRVADMKHSYLAWQDTLYFNVTGYNAEANGIPAGQLRFLSVGVAGISPEYAPSPTNQDQSDGGFWLKAFNPSTGVLNFPAISWGVPFASREEHVNLLQINECQKNFGRFASAFMLCDKEGVENTWVLSPNGSGAGLPISLNDVAYKNPTKQNNPAWQGFCGMVTPNVYGLVSRTYPKLGGNYQSRQYWSINQTETPTEILFSNIRSVVIPLSLVSVLASTTSLVPLGLLSQLTNYGWQLRLQLASNSNQYVVAREEPLVLSPLAPGGLTAGNGANYFQTLPLFNESSVQYRLYNPRILMRYPTIHDSAIVQSLVDDFNGIPRQITVGADEEGRPVTAMVNQGIKVNYNDQHFYDVTIPAGSTQFKHEMNLSSKNLKGCLFRFSVDDIFTDQSLEKNLVDYPLNLKTSYFTIGHLQFPKNDIAGLLAGQTPSGTANNQYVDLTEQIRAMGSSGRHLFDPSDQYGDVYPLYQYSGGGIGRFNTSAGFTPRFGVISFQSFDNIPKESGDSSELAYGLNTYVLGNKVGHWMVFGEPLPKDVTISYCFVTQETLSFVNGNVEKVYDKSVVA